MKHVDLSAAPDPRVTLEHVNCPLGCDDGDVPVLTGRDRISNLPGQFQVLRCGGCGLLRTSPRPSPQTIGFYYPEDYGPYVDTRISSAGRGCLPALRQRMVALGQRLFDTKAHAIPAMPAGRMLEIGCASGSYLNKMASEGWEVEGIEFSAAAAAAARAQGFAVHVGPVETADRPNGGYDLVVGWMVLEPTRLAVLDHGLVVRIVPWPQLGLELFNRGTRRAHHLAVALAIAHHNRVEDRLLLTLWHLAERWGKVTPDGILVPLPLSHERLASIVGAHRPSVTTALGALNKAGKLSRRDDGGWLLHGEPPEKLRHHKLAAALS